MHCIWEAIQGSSAAICNRSTGGVCRAHASGDEPGACPFVVPRMEKGGGQRGFFLLMTSPLCMMLLLWVYAKG